MLSDKALHRLAELERQAHYEEQRTVGGQIADIPRSVGSGLLSAIGGGLRGAQTGIDAVASEFDVEPVERRPEEGTLGRAGEALATAIEPDPVYQDTLTSQLATGVGSMAGFVGTGAAGRAASALARGGRAGPAASAGPVAGLAAGTGIDEARTNLEQFLEMNPEQAEEMGLSQNDINQFSARYGWFPGVINVAPVEMILRRVPNDLRRSSGKYMARRIGEAFGAEATVEGAAAILQNDLRQMYDEDAEIMEGVGGRAALGGASAGLIQGVLLAPFLRRARNQSLPEGYHGPDADEIDSIIEEHGTGEEGQLEFLDRFQPPEPPDRTAIARGDMAAAPPAGLGGRITPEGRVESDIERDIMTLEERRRQVIQEAETPEQAAQLTEQLATEEGRTDADLAAELQTLRDTRPAPRTAPPRDPGLTTPDAPEAVADAFETAREEAALEGGDALDQITEASIRGAQYIPQTVRPSLVERRQRLRERQQMEPHESPRPTDGEIAPPQVQTFGDLAQDIGPQVQQPPAPVTGLAARRAEATRPEPTPVEASTTTRPEPAQPEIARPTPTPVEASATTRPEPARPEPAPTLAERRGVEQPGSDPLTGAQVGDTVQFSEGIADHEPSIQDDRGYRVDHIAEDGTMVVTDTATESQQTVLAQDREAFINEGGEVQITQPAATEAAPDTRAVREGARPLQARRQERQVREREGSADIRREPRVAPEGGEATVIRRADEAPAETAPAETAPAEAVAERREQPQRRKKTPATKARERLGARKNQYVTFSQNVDMIPASRPMQIVGFKDDGTVQLRERGTDALHEVTLEQLNEFAGDITRVAARSKRPVDGTAPMFSRKPMQGKPLKADQVRASIRAIAQGWKDRPKTNIAPNFDALPKTIKQYARDHGAQGDMRAILWRDGQLYFVADRFDSARAIEEAMLHESIGHYGLRKLMGEDITPFLNRVYMNYANTQVAKDTIEAYFGADRFDPTNQEHRLQIAEELLAHMAEARAYTSLTNRVLQAINDGLRKLGFSLKLNRFDLQKALRQADEILRQGGMERGFDAMTHLNEPRFQRGDPRHDETGQERMRRMDYALNNFWQQPVDRLFRGVFDLAGVVDTKGRVKRGVWLTDKVEYALTTWQPQPDGRFAFLTPYIELARAGVLSQHGLSEKYREKWREAEAFKRQKLQEVADILKGLKHLSADEAHVLTDILQGEVIADENWQQISEPIRRAIEELGQLAVDQGLITQETFDRNKGEYLHISYQHHEAQFTGLSKWLRDMQTRNRRRVMGETAMRRGQANDTERSLRSIIANLDAADKAKAQTREGRDELKRDKKFKRLFPPPKPGQESAHVAGGEPQSIATTGVRQREVWWPDDKPLPKKYQNYRHEGTYHIHQFKKNGSRAVVTRPFTKEERQNMGQIMDARYNIARTFQKVSHDIAMGKFFSDIAAEPEWFSREEPAGRVTTADKMRSVSELQAYEWVYVPDTGIKSAQLKRYGDLAGGYVRAEIWRDLQELDKMHNPGTWGRLLKQWKLNKTARSPVVHMNNVMSNLVLMDLADVSMKDLMDGIASLRHGDYDFQRAEELGAFAGTFVTNEIVQDVLRPVLDEMVQDYRQHGESLSNKLWSQSKMLYTLKRKLQDWDEWGINMYQLEDMAFRMATYKRRLQMGDGEAEAARIAREQFLDYDIRAPWVNTLRRSVLPFISYTYRAGPVIAKSIAHRPWKLAKYATMVHLMQSLMYELWPGDEDEERRTLRPEEQGRLWFGVPRMLRLHTDAHGDPVMLDIRRWIPGGDIFDLGQGQSTLPLPAPMVPGGPAIMAMEAMLNVNAFTGEEIVNPHLDGLGERIKKTADFAWKSHMPSAPWIPGSHHASRLWGVAVHGEQDIRGRNYSLGQAALSSVGVKARSHDVEMNMRWRQNDLERLRREIGLEVRRAHRDFERNRLSENQRDARIERALENARNLRERHARLMGRE